MHPTPHAVTPPGTVPAACRSGTSTPARATAARSRSRLPSGRSTTPSATAPGWWPRPGTRTRAGHRGGHPEHARAAAPDGRGDARGRGVVVAMGDCARNCGVFAGAYGVVGAGRRRRRRRPRDARAARRSRDAIVEALRTVTGTVTRSRGRAAGSAACWRSLAVGWCRSARRRRRCAPLALGRLGGVGIVGAVTGALAWSAARGTRCRCRPHSPFAPFAFAPGRLGGFFMVVVGAVGAVAVGLRDRLRARTVGLAHRVDGVRRLSAWRCSWCPRPRTPSRSCSSWEVMAVALDRPACSPTTPAARGALGHPLVRRP